MGIILPSDLIDYTGARGWRAFDLTPADIAPLLDRFHSRYERGMSDECWPWLGYTDPAGYGVIRRSRAHRQPNLLAHRVAWVAASGEALTGNLTIDHLCFTRGCVNPSHLEPVTMEENARRARRALGERRPRPRMSEEEARQKRQERKRHAYWADPEAARAKKATKKACPTCGNAYRAANLARHRQRTHGGAA
jgi:ribosomal protein S27AE